FVSDARSNSVASVVAGASGTYINLPNARRHNTASRRPTSIDAAGNACDSIARSMSAETDAFTAFVPCDLLGNWQLQSGRAGREPAGHRREIVRSRRLRADEAVVGEEDEAGRAEATGGLDVVDGLRRRQAIAADAGPHGARP